MKPARTYQLSVLALALSCVATNSAALVLGGVRGPVYLGQPLKLTVPLQLGPEEFFSDLCLVAEVWYGDIPQAMGEVTPQGEPPLEPGQSMLVTVSAPEIVNEPVITVVVRANCEHKTSRRYVLLADLPPGVAPSSSKSVVLPSPAVPAAAPPKQVEDILAAVPKPVKKPATVPRPVVPKLKKVAKAPEPALPKAPAHRSHLTVDLLDLGSPALQDFSLKPHDALTFGQDIDVAKHAQAQIVWPAASAASGAALSYDANRVQAMEQNLKDLQDITAKNRAVLQDLNHRLDTATTNRYSPAVVYTLLAALLLCGAALLYTWVGMRRDRRLVPPWWREPQTDSVEDFAEPTGTDKGVMSLKAAAMSLKASAPAAPGAATKAAAPRAPAQEGGIDFDLGASAFIDLAHAKPQPQRDFAESTSVTTTRTAQATEMLDAVQQAGFFLTLGQNDAAIGVLKSSIETNPQSSPDVYLELLNLLHTLGRKAEYSQYRTAFNALFTGRVPAYTAFGQGGDGLLEAYPEVCRELVALWPGPAVVDYIEAALLRRPDANGVVPEFDLEAFRDLLLLRSIAAHTAVTAPSPAGKAPAPDDATVRIARSSGAPTAAIDLDLSEVPAGRSQPGNNLIDFDLHEATLTKPRR